LFAIKTSTKTTNPIVRNSPASLILSEKSTQKNQTRQEKLFDKSSIPLKSYKKHPRTSLNYQMIFRSSSAKGAIPPKKIQMTHSMNISSSMPRNILKA
jgi:type IV secretory pathway component VirB8